MAGNEFLRRPSYGPTSPVVGQRGTRTRARIVASTLVLFESQGFHETSVDDIARAAGISRATLYQYFESKEKIFIELLDECGTALMRVIRRIGPLGPNPLGFDNLHWWLGEWAWVYDKYATMFVQWATVDSPGSTVRTLVQEFLRAYDRRIAERLVSSGVTGIDPDDTAMVLTTLVNRFNYFRHIGLARDVPTDELIDALAVVIQLILFPQTPPEAFAEVGRESPGPVPHQAPSRANGRIATNRQPAPRRPGGPEPAPAAGRFEHLSPRAAGTVRQLLDAGVTLFAERGYHRASVDDIVALAGFARGTFYKYFDEKLDLLVALSDEAGRTADAFGQGLEKIAGNGAGLVDFRRWLADFLAFEQRYVGVSRTWLEKTPKDVRLSQARRHISSMMRAAFTRLLGQFERPYPLDLESAGFILFALLERLPEMAESDRLVSTDDFVDLVATLIERGLFNGRLAGRPEGPVDAAR